MLLKWAITLLCFDKLPLQDLIALLDVFHADRELLLLLFEKERTELRLKSEHVHLLKSSKDARKTYDCSVSLSHKSLRNLLVYKDCYANLLTD